MCNQIRIGMFCLDDEEEFFIAQRIRDGHMIDMAAGTHQNEALENLGSVDDDEIPRIDSFDDMLMYARREEVRKAEGTEFQRKVWDFLMSTSPGDVLTYSEVAERIGNPGAHRAVANACASNRHAIVIPCHRVVRKDGKSSGYRWGNEVRSSILAAGL